MTQKESDENFNIENVDADTHQENERMRMTISANKNSKEHKESDNPQENERMRMTIPTPGVNIPRENVKDIPDTKEKKNDKEFDNKKNKQSLNTVNNILMTYTMLIWWTGTILLRSLISILNQKVGNQKIMIMWMIISTQIMRTLEDEFRTGIKEIEHHKVAPVTPKSS